MTRTGCRLDRRLLGQPEAAADSEAVGTGGTALGGRGTVTNQAQPAQHIRPNRRGPGGSSRTSPGAVPAAGLPGPSTATDMARSCTRALTCRGQSALRLNWKTAASGSPLRIVAATAVSLRRIVRAIRVFGLLACGVHARRPGHPPLDVASRARPRRLRGAASPGCAGRRPATGPPAARALCAATALTVIAAVRPGPCHGAITDNPMRSRCAGVQRMGMEMGCLRIRYSRIPKQDCYRGLCGRDGCVRNGTGFGRG